MRQAIFDMLVHASWGGRALLDGASVLDAFAGTGALGLEALSRGAAQVVFIENNAQALRILGTNVASCNAASRARVIEADVLRAPRGARQTIVFLDPPYGRGLIPLALQALREAGWVASGTLIVAETGRLETVHIDHLARKTHGAAQVTVWREP